MAYSPSLIHVPQPLLDLAQAYTPDEDDYVRGLLLPRKPVKHRSDLIRVVSKESVLRLYDLDMASPTAIAPEVQFGVGDNLQYACKPYFARSPISSIDADDADAALQFELRQTRQALTSMGLRQEYEAVKNVLRSTSVMTQNVTLSAGSRWDDFSTSSSDPMSDLQGAIETIRIQIGRAGKKARIKVVMHSFAWMTLRQHPNVIDRVRFQTGSTGAVLTRAILAGILDINEEDIHITAAQYTSNQQGETAAYKAFMGSDVLVAYVDDGGLNDFSLGHTFEFNGFAGTDPMFVRKYRVEQEGLAGMDWVQVATLADYKVTNPTAGFLLKTVINASNTSRYGTMLD